MSTLYPLHKGKKMAKWPVCLVTAALLLIASAAADSSDETVEVNNGGAGEFPNQACSQILRALLANINIQFDSDNDTLTVAGFQQLNGGGDNGEIIDLQNNSTNSAALNSFTLQQPPLPTSLPPTTLDDIIAACGTDYFNVELWRAIQSPNRPSGFGTWEYFSQFQNCENPNPDLLWKHGSSIQESLAVATPIRRQNNGDDKSTNSSANTPDEVDPKNNWGFAGPVKFFHVVERQYLIRMCPCRRVGGRVIGGGGAGANTGGGKQHKCSCDHGSAAVCSEIMNVTTTARQDQVHNCNIVGVGIRYIIVILLV